MKKTIQAPENIRKKNVGISSLIKHILFVQLERDFFFERASIIDEYFQYFPLGCATRHFFRVFERTQHSNGLKRVVKPEPKQLQMATVKHIVDTILTLFFILFID
jgi:hypothetical protein